MKNLLLEKTIAKLELPRVLNEASRFAASKSGKNRIINLIPSSNYAEVQHLILQTAEADKYISTYNVNPDFNFDPVSEIAERAAVLSTLSCGELLKVMRMLKICRITQSLFSSSYSDVSILKAQADTLYFNKIVEDQINFAIISDEEVNDRATEKLYSIRQSIRRINAEIKDKLNSYMRSGELSRYMQDSLVTVRSDRYVIPVKQEYKNLVNGLIHDQSASGATVFIEPIAIVNFNNQLKQFLIEESQEIERILYDFTSIISTFSTQLLQNENILSELDCVFAKAYYAHSTRSCLPEINNKGIIKISSGRHPLLKVDKIVPLNIYLGTDFNLIVITGPNTGGKTVALKTVGLFTLMAECGLFVPASYCELSTFDNICVDIGDEQSIEQSLSTFSSHILNIGSIIKIVDKRTLVLFDEVGAGTEPNEGAALAIAITEFILESGAKGIITTHYSQLKEYALTKDNIENACMEFSPSTFEPTYKLIMGIPGSSNAIEIAKRLNMNEIVIAKARAHLTTESITFENVLRQAEEIRQSSQKEKEMLEDVKKKTVEEYDKVKNNNKQLVEQREQLLKGSKSEARRIINDAQDQAEDLLSQLKDMVKKGLLEEKELFKARGLISVADNSKYFADEEVNNIFTGEALDINKIKVGQNVFVSSLNSTATVMSIKKNNKVEVAINNIKSIVPISQLFYAIDLTVRKKASASVKTEVKTRLATSEINLLGLNVDQAISEVDKFIDNATICGLKTLRVIHGMGTGALRAGLHKYFATHPSIDSYRLGKYGEGESGVTIVTLVQ